jgi:hypothetical protein
MKCNSQENGRLQREAILLEYSRLERSRLLGFQFIAMASNSREDNVAALNIEQWCNIHCLFLLSLRFWRVLYMGGIN